MRWEVKRNCTTDHCKYSCRSVRDSLLKVKVKVKFGTEGLSSNITVLFVMGRDQLVIGRATLRLHRAITHQRTKSTSSAIGFHDIALTGDII